MTRTRQTIREWGPAGLVGVVTLAALVWILPIRGRNPLLETTVWSLLVVGSFAGWGSLLCFGLFRTERVDLGLRIAWGASVVCFLGGVLMVPSLMTRGTAFLLVEAGLVLALAALALERKAVGAFLAFCGRLSRREPGLMLLAGVVAVFLAVRYLAAISNWHTDPYDDDVAYLAFVRKLSDTGSVVEPFSFRRIAAYGGQTLFIQLLSLRAAPSQGHTFDRGVALLSSVLLVLGFRDGRRRPTLLVLLVAVALLLAIPTSILNTASYYSGVAFFFALYRTLKWLGDRRSSAAKAPGGAAWKSALPLALVAAATCTLRQNYLPVPVVALAAVFVAELRRGRGPLVARLAAPLWAVGLSFVALVPWFVSSWQSSHTFLFPVLPGTFHRALGLQASDWNLVRELALQASVIVEGLPLKTFAFFLLAAALLRSSGERRLVWSFGLAVLCGLVAVTHGFSQSDPLNIGRYAFGFTTAFALAVLLTLGTSRAVGHPRTYVGAGIALFAALLQIVLSREVAWKEYMLGFRNIEALHDSVPRGVPTTPPEVGLYRRLQGAVPAGERIVVMVDEPYHLDYARNPIWNLDMPGFASLPPGVPNFKGSEAVERYFRGLGVRYFMYVDPAYSRYNYRREYALGLFVSDQEL